MSLNDIAKIVKYATVVNEFTPVSYRFYPKTKNLEVTFDNGNEISQWTFPTSDIIDEEYFRQYEKHCLKIIGEK